MTQGLAPRRVVAGAARTVPLVSVGRPAARACSPAPAATTTTTAILVAGG